MKLVKWLTHCLGMLAICTSPTSLAVNVVTFASGAPLDGYQARVIIPILTEAFAQQNVEFNAVYLPSLRALQISNSGMLDGELHRVAGFHEITQDKYNNLIKIDHKLLSVYLAIFAKENVIVDNWDDLNHYALAYYRGRKNVDSYLSNVGAQYGIYKVNTDKQAFRMLASNKVDIVISESHFGNSLINSSDQLSGIKEIKRLDKTDIYAYIHNKHQHLLPALVRALEQMKAQGIFKQIKAQAQQSQSK